MKARCIWVPISLFHFTDILFSFVEIIHEVTSTVGVTHLITTTIKFVDR